MELKQLVDTSRDGTPAQAAEHARELGGDPSRLAAVGESAGGNMALAICYNARREGVPLPVHQVLVYPIAGHDTDTESYREVADALPLNTPAMEWFFEQYLNSPQDGRTPAIAPAQADLAGLPPATIINAELDPLRIDGELLAQRFRAAGVQVEQRTFDGVTHEFFGMSAVLTKAREAQQMAADALTRAFGAARWPVVHEVRRRAGNPAARRRRTSA